MRIVSHDPQDMSVKIEIAIPELEAVERAIQAAPMQEIRDMSATAYAALVVVPNVLTWFSRDAESGTATGTMATGTARAFMALAAIDPALPPEAWVAVVADP